MKSGGLMKLLKELDKYIPFNEQESNDKTIIMNAIKSHKNIFSRDNLSFHMTASAWVTNTDRSQILMIHHNIYNSWSWMGGHADNDKDLFHVAMKEVKEESGIKSIVPIIDDIFSLEVLTVDGHQKNGKYVSSHLHLNITYLFQASLHDELKICPSENSGVKWFTLEDAIDASTEPWFQENVYKKLNNKLKAIR